MYSLLLFEEIFYFVVHWHQPLSLPDHAKLQVIVYNWGGGCCGRQFVILQECFLQPLSVLVVPLGPPGWQRPGGELIKVTEPIRNFVRIAGLTLAWDIERLLCYDFSHGWVVEWARTSACVQGELGQQEVLCQYELLHVQFLSLTCLDNKSHGVIVHLVGLDLRQVLKGEKSTTFIYEPFVFTA